MDQGDLANGRGRDDRAGAIRPNRSIRSLAILYTSNSITRDPSYLLYIWTATTMASSYFKTLLQRQMAGAVRALSGEAIWLFPAGLAAGWLLWPCLDLEWKIEMGLAKDPDHEVFMIQDLKNKRYEAKFGKPPGEKSEAADEEEEEEEEEAAEEEEDAADEDEGESGPGDEDEEETKIVVPPLYVPTKGKLSKEQVWDNYTIKVRFIIGAYTFGKHKFLLG